MLQTNYDPNKFYPPRVKGSRYVELYTKDQCDINGTLVAKDDLIRAYEKWKESKRRT